VGGFLLCGENNMQDASIMRQTVPVNDMEMYCESRGEGEPLLLLHGFSGLGRDWELIFKEPPTGHRLIAPDLRGHGHSTNPARKFTFRQAALDVLAFLDALGVNRFKAIGLSGGAKTLLHVATLQPARVEAMILVSGAPSFPAQARKLMAQMTVESHGEQEWEFMRRRHPGGDAQIRMLWEQGHAFKDSYDDVNFTAPFLSIITARTLIMYGDRDPLYPVDLALEMYHAIPNSYLWVVPNGAHGPIFGEMAPKFVQTAVSFLNGAWT
jgi:pimeloyl-ACP methyl ester carboxylesterase